MSQTDHSYGHRREFSELFVADSHFGDTRAAQTRGFGGSEAGVHQHDLTGIFSLVSAIIRAAVAAPEKPVRLHVLGDISNGRSHDAVAHGLDAFHRIRHYVELELSGTEVVMVLYPGNHDSCSQMQPWCLERRDLHLRTGDGPFDVITDQAVLKLQLDDGTHQDVLLSHLPYWRIGDGFKRHTRKPERSARYQQWRLPDLGLPLIHGHTHDETPHIEHAGGTDFSALCVSRDAWGAAGVATMQDVNAWVKAWRGSALTEAQKYDWRRDTTCAEHSLSRS